MNKEKLVLACFVLIGLVVLIVGIRFDEMKANETTLQEIRARVEPCIEVIYYPDDPKFGVNRGQYIAEIKKIKECKYLYGGDLGLGA